MNIKEYISSGILEYYVLGLASTEERKEVEMYSSTHPEIKKEIDAIEAAMEQYAQLHALEKPAGIGTKINAKIDSLEQLNSSSSTRTSNGFLSNGGLTILLGVLSLLLGILAFSNYQNKHNQAQEIATLEGNLSTQKKDCDEISRQNAALRASLLILQDPDNQFIKLIGTDNAPGAIASVIYNKETRKSYLSIDELAAPATDKQYQLWAIVDGVPVDMGVFELELNKDTLQEVPFIENSEAFAVTLEKRGGNPTPTLDQMVLIGNAS